MAVYTEVGDDDLVQFLTAYDIGEVQSFKGIAEGVENTNYVVHTTGGSYILTLYEKRVRRGDLPFFLGLMEHLAAAGIACPLPVKARDGSALRELCGRPAAVITFLEGMWPRRIEPWHCEALGRALAGLHLTGLGYTGVRPNALSVGGWARLLDDCGSRADEVAPGLAIELGAAFDALARDWPAAGAPGLQQGVIHADLFPDNVFFRGRTLSGLIDFYFACTDFLAYDLAVCLNAWCFEPDGAFNATKARRLTEAYQRVRPLTAQERAMLPVFARGAALRFLLTRLYDWLNHPPGAFVKPKDPLEYLRKLRFHATIDGPGPYGLVP